MEDLLAKYGYVPDKANIDRNIDNIARNLDAVVSEKVYKECFSFMDLTSLHTEDTEKSVTKLVSKVNGLQQQYPGYPLPASICVFPNFAAVVKNGLTCEQVHVTTVAGCFPTSQSYLEVKIRECELAVENGADEVDIVLALNAFLAEDYRRASSEIKAIRSAVDETGAKLGKSIILKVILETGLLLSTEKIARASFLAMEAGADFIKTSTGKVDVNATPAGAFVMCMAIKKFHEQTGKKVGFKAAGGISSAKDAVSYYAIVAKVLGKEWLCKDLFRLGVSRLGNSLMSAIEQKTVMYF